MQHQIGNLFHFTNSRAIFKGIAYFYGCGLYLIYCSQHRIDPILKGQCPLFMGEKPLFIRQSQNKNSYYESVYSL